MYDKKIKNKWISSLQHFSEPLVSYCVSSYKEDIYISHIHMTQKVCYLISFLGGAGEMAQSLKARLTTKNKNLFLDLFIYLLIYECFICIYTCMPEEGIRSLYRWL